jgi:hypothetical protein
VRYHVVQLARDAGLLLGASACRLRLPLALEPLGLLLQFLHVAAADPDAVAGEPRDRERQQPAEHQVRMAPAGDGPQRRREDDERSRARDEREPPLESRGDREQRNPGRKRVVGVAPDGDRRHDGRYAEDGERVAPPPEQRQGK